MAEGDDLAAEAWDGRARAAGDRAAQQEPPVVFLTRFSWLGLSGRFYAGGERPLSDRAADLFAPERLTRRLSLFRAVCLPALVAQPPDLARAVVLTSTRLPDATGRALEDLLAPHPNVMLTALPPLDHHADAFAAALPPSGATRITVRLDDDDAVAADLARRLSRYLGAAHHGHVVTFDEGWLAAPAPAGPRLWPTRWRLGSAGFAHVAPPGATRNAYHCGNHVTADRRYPVIADPAPDAWLRVLHGGNDSDVRSERPPDDALDPDGAAARLAPAFPFLDPGTLRRLLASPRRRPVPNA